MKRLQFCGFGLFSWLGIWAQCSQNIVTFSVFIGFFLNKVRTVLIQTSVVRMRVILPVTVSITQALGQNFSF